MFKMGSGNGSFNSIGQSNVDIPEITEMLEREEQPIFIVFFQSDLCDIIVSIAEEYKVINVYQIVFNVRILKDLRA